MIMMFVDRTGPLWMLHIPQQHRSRILDSTCSPTQSCSSLLHEHSFTMPTFQKNTLFNLKMPLILYKQLLCSNAVTASWVKDIKSRYKAYNNKNNQLDISSLKKTYKCDYLCSYSIPKRLHTLILYQHEFHSAFTPGNSHQNN